MMPTAPRQSRRVGSALAADGVRTTAYQACVPHPCSDCGRVIASGELFSRRSRKVVPLATGQLHTVPVCTACRPLQMGEPAGAAGHGAWTQQTAHAWVYHVPDRTRPFGYALRHREDGPTGARWDGMLVGQGIDKKTLLVDGVTLEEAKAAVERAGDRRPWPQTGCR